MKRPGISTSIALIAMFLLGMGSVWFWRPIISKGVSIDPRLEQNSQTGGHGADATSPDGSPRREATISTPSMPERTKLEAHLFRYSWVANADVAEALDQMTEVESQALVRQLRLFKDKIERHEMESAILLSASDSRIEISIPPLRRKGEENPLLAALSKDFGEGRANQLIGMADRIVGLQTAFWGAAEQTITIELSASSYNCDNRIEYPDGSRMSRWGTSFSDGQRSHYHHIFEALNITRLTQPGGDAADDRPAD